MLRMSAQSLPRHSVTRNKSPLFFLTCLNIASCPSGLFLEQKNGLFFSCSLLFFLLALEILNPQIKIDCLIVGQLLLHLFLLSADNLV